MRFKLHLALFCQRQKKEDSPFDESLVAEMGFEPHDLRVMSPTSYQTAPLRDIWCRKPGSNRYEKLISRDFKSRASANSAIPAYNDLRFPNRHYIISLSNENVKYFFVFFEKIRGFLYKYFPMLLLYA